MVLSRNDLIESGERAVNGDLSTRGDFSRISDEFRKRERSHRVGMQAVAINDWEVAAYEIDTHQKLWLVNFPVT